MTGRSGRREAGQLENALLAVLWAAPTALSSAQAQQGLREQGLDLAYTSVATTLTRLHAKGLLERSSAGRTYVYTPSGRAAQEAAARMRSLLGGGRARAVVLSHFVDGLEPGDEATLLELLRRAEADPGDQAGRSPARPGGAAAGEHGGNEPRRPDTPSDHS
ncbi:BlaI/MecI/CopY family transcriptional regulator [Frankia sp. AgPm24]|uniref:BlaI/MecI/CopY family transcriptional regulator n=1 Tax=Frankia umida TaxID=573489 RepID=A0ABT0JSS8_9ACTN|nr:MULTISPECIES: BlaI/MecI/CopY family transcriptional regulator [Frankia]MCK9874605.1 BlaI/MecI/CopY family transcriptional regulator [Frankia umida]MCK9922713.1 BlaI/MecI/CopY family transcriptional regulator [Frankia sp. AgPm24]